MTDMTAEALAAQHHAQECANASGRKWVWYEVGPGCYRCSPAKVLHLVQLNDTVLAGEIVVLERARQKEVYNLVWPETVGTTVNLKQHKTD